MTLLLPTKFVGRHTYASRVILPEGSIGLLQKSNEGGRKKTFQKKNIEPIFGKVNEKKI